MDIKIDIEKEDRRMPFTLPDDYFEQFAAKIEAQIEPQRKRKTIKQLMRPIVAAAAAFAALILGSYFFITMQGVLEANNENVLAQEQYVEAVAEEIDGTQLEDILAEIHW